MKVWTRYIDDHTENKQVLLCALVYLAILARRKIVKMLNITERTMAALHANALE